MGRRGADKSALTVIEIVLGNQIILEGEVLNMTFQFFAWVTWKISIAINQDRKQRNNNTAKELSMSSMFKLHNKPLNQICSYYPHFSDKKKKNTKESA